eukprot:SM000119S25625  [mRNA]  locus=s119:621:4431:+ [translate_table: standard]
MLSFNQAAKQAFEVPVADVSGTQMQGKSDVLLEFHVDDTAGAIEVCGRDLGPSLTHAGAIAFLPALTWVLVPPGTTHLQKDVLMEMTFHVPSNNTRYVGSEATPSAQVFRDRLAVMADAGPSGAEAVALFEEVGILTPRGRYTVELHLSFLRLQGQANDFKIQYSSVVRIFVLPKPNQPHTFVIVSLDPPIRKGQTFYPHIVLQFPTEEITECTLSMSEDLLTNKYKERLEASYKGLSYEVFSTILRGLSGAKVTRPGKYRSAADGYALRTSLKAEDGYLFPLEKGFFFLPKPPTLILHEEIEYVAFERHGAAGMSSTSSHYFDLVLRLTSEQEHQFRNIQRNEFHNLLSFVRQAQSADTSSTLKLDKGLKILNPEAQGGGATGVAAALESDDEAVDPHMNRIQTARQNAGVVADAGGAQDESDEEDEDFVGGGDDDGGSPTDESEAGSAGSDGGNASDNDEEEEAAKPKRKAAAPKPSRKRKPANEAGGDDDAGGATGKPKKRQRKKKDPSAPKRALSGFMYYSQAERENLKKETGKSFGELGKALGENWKAMTATEKEPYEAKARADKVRYTEQIKDYRSKGAAAPADSGGGDSDGSDNDED